MVCDVLIGMNIGDNYVGIYFSTIWLSFNDLILQFQTTFRGGGGVTQGDPLAMITYGIGILPLINNIKREIPVINQPWYADDAGALRNFVRIETYFNSLIRQCPVHGYYPKPSKSVLIVNL